MAEQFISEREEQVRSTVDRLRASLAGQTPAEKAERFQAGVDMMVDDLEENRAFYARMKGVAALRTTVQRQESDAIYANARQLYGPLGYDTSPREIHRS